MRCTEAECRALAEGAGRVGLTVGGYAATLALTRTQATSTSDQAVHALLVELLAARGQLRRFGNNVNQAVRALNSIGEPPPWLLDAVRLADQAVRGIDQAVDRIAASSRVRSVRAGRPWQP